MKKNIKLVEIHLEDKVDYRVYLDNFEKSIREKFPPQMVEAKGGLWEEENIKIHYNYFCDNIEFPCPHAKIFFHLKVYNKKDDGTEFLHYNFVVGIIPRVVEAYNEGGYCSTGICWDCVQNKMSHNLEKKLWKKNIK